MHWKVTFKLSKFKVEIHKFSDDTVYMLFQTTSLLFFSLTHLISQLVQICMHTIVYNKKNINTTEQVVFFCSYSKFKI